jgi:hypothetical protein
MEKAVFETFGLFLAPFLLFAIYLVARLRFPWAVEHWTRGRLGWMTLFGVGAATLGLIVINLAAPRGHGLYIPAHIEKGAIVPGRFQ